MPRVWVVRADGGNLTDEFLGGGYASIGWGMDDVTSAKSAEEVEALYRQTHTEETSKPRIRTQVGQIHRFLNEFEPGDYIVTPARRSGILHYGTVVDAPPCFVDQAPDDEDQHRNRRKVSWGKETLLRGGLSVPFQRALTAWLTVFSLDKHQSEFFAAIGREDLVVSIPSDGKPEFDAYSLALARLMQFDPFEFEELIGALLEAMGYEMVRVVGKSGDGGVDVIGTLHVSTLAEIQLFVQVKRYQPDSKINKSAVQMLRAGIPFGGQGALITTSHYSNNARLAAEEEGFPRIGLIDGRQLVDLLTLHWTLLPEEFRDRLGLKPGLVPA